MILKYIRFKYVGTELFYLNLKKLKILNMKFVKIAMLVALVAAAEEEKKEETAKTEEKADACAGFSHEMYSDDACTKVVAEADYKWSNKLVPKKDVKSGCQAEVKDGDKSYSAKVTCTAADKKVAVAIFADAACKDGTEDKASALALEDGKCVKSGDEYIKLSYTEASGAMKVAAAVTAAAVGVFSTLM